MKIASIWRIVISVDSNIDMERRLYKNNVRSA